MGGPSAGRGGRPPARGGRGWLAEARRRRLQQMCVASQPHILSWLAAASIFKSLAKHCSQTALLRGHTF
jgi:hypothetical protein